MAEEKDPAEEKAPAEEKTLAEEKAPADEAEIRLFLSEVMRGNVLETVLRPAGASNKVLEEVPPGIGDRMKAGELLGKSMGLFTDSRGEGGSIVIYGADLVRE